MLAARAGVEGMVPGDVVMVAQKVVSKAEGRIVSLAEVVVGADARALAEATGKEPALCALILSESRRIVRQRGATVICETHHGFVCANAGIDASNTPEGAVILLPRDPDASARLLQARIAAVVGGRVGVVVTDTHGRAFRRGLVNVAIGVAGFAAIVDHRGARGHRPGAGGRARRGGGDLHGKGLGHAGGGGLGRRDDRRSRGSPGTRPRSRA
jgi:coenzyme F420-0:L-glutamate ligase/coenzyme F420-1:gamma-L-glutamate ligase